MLLAGLVYFSYSFSDKIESDNIRIQSLEAGEHYGQTGRAKVPAYDQIYYKSVDGLNKFIQIVSHEVQKIKQQSRNYQKCISYKKTE